MLKLQWKEGKYNNASATAGGFFLSVSWASNGYKAIVCGRSLKTEFKTMDEAKQSAEKACKYLLEKALTSFA